MAMTADEQAYDVQVEFTVPAEHNRLWAVPVLGIVVKLIILIPHLILLYVLGIVATVLALVTWIPVLFGGHYPSWGYDVIGGTLRWGANFSAYLYGLTDRYPPFRLGKAAEDEEPYEVDVDFNVPEEHNRLWAIPVIGIVIKLIILIPHLILLYVLGIVADSARSGHLDSRTVRRPLSLLGLRNHRRVPTLEHAGDCLPLWPDRPVPALPVGAVGGSGRASPSDGPKPHG